MRTLFVAAVLSAVALAGQQAPPSQLPTFRTGVDVVELDVTVLDRDRRPVKGLTAGDFVILEHGSPQPIVAFAAIDVPPAPRATALWVRDAPLDVVTNAENRRLVTIVMDDAYATAEPGLMRRAKQIAYSAIDQLGPDDLASVIFTLQGRPQNFTADRQRLKAAVDSFVPKMSAFGPPIACDPKKMTSCDVNALAIAASSLVAAPPGRKIAILISGGRAFTFGEMGDPKVRNEGPELQDMFRNLQRANIAVYAYDAHGLEVGGMSAATQMAGTVGSPQNDSLYSFAASTGGRAFANTNDPASLVPDAFRESSTYYLIGFQASTVDDGRFHKLDVKVNRQGVEVRTRRGYYSPTSAKSEVETINGLPAGNLPLEATAAAFAVPGRREAEVIVVGHLPSAERRNVALAATAIDLDGKLHGTQRQTIEVMPAAGSRGPDLPSHLPLAPGRYMIRLAADSEGKSGSVFVDVDVPNFAKSSLSMSGLVVQRGPAAPSADSAIAAIIPIAPTTQRTFSSADDVSVYARVYQGEKGRLVPVRMVSKVTNARNDVVSHQEQVLEPEQFGAARAAEYRVRLPLTNLEPGSYLFEVEAKSGAPLARRTIRFAVGRAGA